MNSYVNQKELETQSDFHSQLVSSSNVFNDNIKKIHAEEKIDFVWSKAFQNAQLNIKNKDFYDEEEMYEKLRKISSDFVYTATIYGKIIIEENYLSVEEKSIKPISIGGTAGGSKYRVQEILFKFAVDNHGLYHGDEFAAS